jgi:photosystem II stability/assembly factor-like uncharacterized protein
MTKVVSIYASVALFCASLGWAGAPEADVPPTYDPALFSAMKYRNIGPFRGGRVTAVAGVPSQPDTFYMGATGGGVWKTTDAGETWVNVSDTFFGSGSIGAIAVAESDPNVVYVGTGTACPRGNVSPGDGVYKSTDAGKTWTHIGLREAGQVGRIRVHPTDPDRVYVAALGHIFGPNEERGVFRSRDGGTTWQKALFVSDQAGAVDLAMDASNPRILYAAIWRVVRKPWTLISGGEDGGLYKSTDGGENWNQVTEGLPEGMTGRIAVAVSPANPERVWTLIEAEDGGMFRSDDGGETFRLISKDRKLRQRAWYYTHVYADPLDEDTVYALNTAFYKSVDGGKTYESIRVPHGDNHDLWLNPKNPKILINSNDGGANVSLNGGKTWSIQSNQPTAEFYRVSTDNRFPYRVYGAQQDNSTVSIASRTTTGGITIQNWYPVGGGESGHIAVDPRDANIIYAGSYGGTITRYDHRTGYRRNILDYPQLQLGQAPRDVTYRFQWNAPIRLSPHDPDVLYHASNVVHKSTNEGQSWEVISPDLTRNDEEKQDYSGGPLTRDNTGVEVYGTVFALEESPHQAGLLWVGSDDGLVHLSRDGGANWDDITPETMPEWGQVNMVELSTHAAGRAFLAVTRYKMDDFRPYIFRTDDFGATWELITNGRNGIPSNHFVRVVREDPDRKGLLYAGTEFGMYVSFDDGKTWQSLQLNLPVTPITDMQVKDGDLVVATQGRSFWILDDLTPLQQLTPEVAAAKAHLFTPREAYRMGRSGFSRERSGIGENPPNGAVIHYYFEEAPEEEVTLEILDEAGDVVRSFSSTDEEKEEPASFFDEESKEKVATETGMNRFVWDLRYPDAELAEGAIVWGTRRGPKAVPGQYQVRITAGEWTDTRAFGVKKDPRLATTEGDFQEQFDLAMKIRDLLVDSHQAIKQIREIREQVEDLAERSNEAGQSEKIEEAAEDVVEKLTAIEEKLNQTKSESNQDPLNFPPMLDNQIIYLYGIVAGSEARPTGGSYVRYETNGRSAGTQSRVSRAFLSSHRSSSQPRGRGSPSRSWQA